MIAACLISFAALEMRPCGSGLLARAATGATRAGRRVPLMAEDGAGRELVGRTVQVAPELVEVASEALAFDRVQVEEVERRLSAVAASMDFRVRKVDIPGLMSPVSIFEVGDPTGIDGCDVDSERSDLCGGVLWPGARTAAHALASRGPLAGKHVVELGAGTGLVSMTAAMLGAADVLRHVERAIFCGVTAAGFLPLSPGAQGFGPGLLATHCGGNPTAQTKRPLILHRPNNPGARNG